MPLTKAQRVAAAQKGARTRKRNQNKPAARRSPKASTPVRRRRRATQKKGFLSDLTSAENRNAFKSLASGAIGGGLYAVYDEHVNLNGATTEKRALFAGIGAYVIAVMGKRPNVAAGILGAAAADFIREKDLLSDAPDTQMARMSYADPLQNIPIMMSDDQMYLAANGSDMNLADEFDPTGNYLPAYADTTQY